MENLTSVRNLRWEATVLTLFPEIFPGSLGCSIAGKAIENNLWGLHVVNIRDFAEDKYKTVDDRPFGGGSGMVMRPDIVGKAVDHVLSQNLAEKIIYMSPRGRLLTQNKARELAKLNKLAVICGRFEGLDERVIEEYNIEEISIGDFILSGGELAAMVLIDACVRLLPGVISKGEAVAQESFGDNEYEHLLEYPHYTRPNIWKDKPVPEVLLSGNHKLIDKWRLEQAQNVTKHRRPDLWAKYSKE